MSLFKKTLFSAVTLTILLSLCFSSAFAMDFQGENYILDKNQKKQYIPETYTVTKVITDIGSGNGLLSSPNDLFMDNKGFLYIADSGNNRIVKLDQNLRFVKEYTSAGGMSFNYPEGLFVDDYGDLFIADTKNSRIVHLDADGNFIEQFVKPKSDLLSDVTSFQPSKVAIDKNSGLIYVIQSKQFMTIDAKNEFKSYVGEQEVGFDLSDWLFRRFASDTQKKVVGRREPAAYNNFLLLNQMIYAVSNGQTDQIKIVNSVDNNIFPKAFYGEMSYKTDGTPIYPFFADLTVDRNQVITAIEQNSSRLYQYDGDGNLLMVFGGSGDNDGHYGVPESIVSDGAGNLYVLDSSLNRIQVLSPTKFTRLIHEASGMYMSGNYQQSYNLWNQVKQIDANYPLVRKSLGKIEYKRQQYQQSMQDYKIADDRDGYGKSFQMLRYQFVRQHFLLVVFLLFAFIFALVFLLAFFKRKSKAYDDELNGITSRKGFWPLKIFVLFLFSPVKATAIVKRYRSRFHLLPVVVLFACAVTMRLLYIYTVNYTVSTTSPSQANILLEAGKYVLPLFTWVISSYGLLTIMGGETKFTEVLTCSAYTYAPYLVFMPILILLSRVLSTSEAGLFQSAQVFLILWQIFLLLAAMKAGNDISLRRCLGTAALSVVGILVIWGLFLLMFAMASQIVSFVSEVMQEISYITK